MFKSLIKKLSETAISVAPIVVIVLIVYLISLIPSGPFVNFDGKGVISTSVFVTFFVCSIFLIIGSTLFQEGADNALSKVGSYIGSSITKRGSILLIVIVAFLLGILVTIAEPDLTILSEQVGGAIGGSPWILKIIVGLGVGVFFAIAMVRIIMQKSIKYLFLTTYLIIFAIGCFYGPDKSGSTFISISFDASSVTTGPATVPFVIAFGASVASTRGGKDTSANSFGVSGIMSLGPIISMLLFCLTMKETSVESTASQISTFGDVALESLTSVLYGITPIFLVFLIYNFFVLKLPKKEISTILVGFLYTYIGLYIFFCAANYGFIPLGTELGRNIASNESIYYMFIVLGLTLGVVIVLAEPAVSILNQQVEEISNGNISRKTMTIALALGVAVGITLELCRIVFWGHFSAIYYYVPIYLASVILSFFVPDIYVAVAFDSGGIASGTLSAAFILPFATGTVEQLNEMHGTDYSGFGIAGMVCVFPVLAIEIMGIAARVKAHYLEQSARRRIYEADDMQIIHFEVSSDEN